MPHWELPRTSSKTQAAHTAATTAVDSRSYDSALGTSRSAQERSELDRLPIGVHLHRSGLEIGVSDMHSAQGSQRACLPGISRCGPQVVFGCLCRQ